MPPERGGLDREDRAALRALLERRYPFLRASDIGPRAVTAGECDRCGAEARLVQPCGPPPADAGGRVRGDWALGRGCALAAGVEGWCGGHEAEAEDALRWLADLPADADDVARLWWVATGEVRPDGVLRDRAIAALARPVQSDR